MNEEYQNKVNELSGGKGYAFLTQAQKDSLDAPAPTPAPVDTIRQTYSIPSVETPYIGDSSKSRAEESKIKTTISDYLKQQTGMILPDPYEGITSLQKAEEASQKLLQDRYNALETQRAGNVSAIERDFAQQESQLKDSQKREQGTTSTGLARLGGYLGGSASQMGVLSTLERSHNLEISTLESKKQAAILAAKAAIDDKQFALAREQTQGIRELEKQINDRKNQFFSQVLQLTGEIRQQKTSEREQMRLDIESADKKQKQDKELAETLAPALISMLGEDNAENSTFLEESARDYGIDPNVLMAEVNRYQSERRKEELSAYTPDIKNYNYATAQGFKGSFIDFQKLQRQIQATAIDASEQYGLPVDDPIFFATLRLSSEIGKNAAIKRYANMKNGGKEEEAQNFVDTLIYSGLSVGERKEFNLYSRVGTNSMKALQKIEEFKNTNFNPYKAAVEGFKPLLMLQRDPAYVDLISNITRAQAEITNLIYGANLTGPELERANSFMVDPKRDDLTSVQVKLKGMEEFAREVRVQKFAYGRGDFSNEPTSGGFTESERAALKAQGFSDDIIKQLEAESSGKQSFNSVGGDTNLAVKVAEAIQTHESGGRQVKGASGEFGSFQFMPETWQRISREIAGKVLPQTPENEQKIALAKIEKLLEKHPPREVALIWNTSLGGSEKPLIKKGVNDKGVAYDSGKYADSVIKILNSLG